MVYWITGRRHSGKTTLAKRLALQIPRSIVLDGDEIRSYFPTGYSYEDREANQTLIANFAHILEDQGYTPIIACVSPNRLLRDSLQAEFKECIEIQLPFGELWPGTTYEE